MELLEQIKQAGIVGCGGAGFPTHAKLSCTVDTLIVNGAECEPLLRTDRWLLRHRAREIVTAAGLCGQAVGASQVYIAAKEHYVQALESLEAAIRELGSPVKVFRLQNFYPAGDEQALVLEVTGRVVPPAGGTHLDDCRILCGGPMMGRLYTLEEARQEVVTKTTSGITVLPPDIPLVTERETPLRVILRRAKTSCIQCSRCTELCPRHLSGHPLQPHKIMRKLAYAESLDAVLKDQDVLQAQICSQCGVCEVYACPMGLQPRQVNLFVKDELAKAGLRYQRPEGVWEPQEARAWRKAPSRRMAVRLGVGRYYDYEIDTLLTLEPHRVRLPLKQHIGAPAVPVVQVGDTVALGQRIAACPDGALGANLCASISGVVTAVDSAITIERGNA